jgi:PRC-barrel domain
MIGADVVNAAGDGLGDVKEVVIDPSSGKIACAVISFSGFLGMGEKLFAVPFSALDYDAQEKEYVLDVAKEGLERAPGFDPDHWPAMSDEKWNREIYKYYDRSPYWE